MEKKYVKSEYDMAYMKKNVDKYTVQTKKGIKDRWKEEAAKRGLSLNAFIIQCVEKEING